MMLITWISAVIVNLNFFKSDSLMVAIDNLESPLSTIRIRC